MFKYKNKIGKKKNQGRSSLSLRTKKLFTALLIVTCSLFIVHCHNSSIQNNDNGFASIKTYKDIPGATAEEIAVIEDLQRRGAPLIYASAPNTELFELSDGTLGGFNVLFCNWLSELFGIAFQPVIETLSVRIEKMESGEFAFTTFADDPERREKYFMTRHIAQRSLVMFSIEGGFAQSRIRQERLPRYVFLQDSVIVDVVASVLAAGSYEAVLVPSEEAAYNALAEGMGDFFIAANTVESAFDRFSGIRIEDFLPLTFMPASMTAERPEYEAVISLVSKAIENGADRHLAELYRQGYQDYRKHKFFLQLTDGEKEFVRGNPVIPFATQNMSYPFTFYNLKEEKWEGVVFDILDEITYISGIEFKMPDAPPSFLTTPVCTRMVESGEAFFIPYLIISEDRKDRYLWSEKKHITDYYALLSKRSFRNVELNDIPFERVGIPLNTAFEEVFRQWFPNALYIREYPTTDEAIMALDRGEVDLAMASQSRLTAMTNFFEFSNYKANYIFNYPLDAGFAFNKDKEILRSVFDKALAIIDTERISNQWMTRTYDIETMRLRQQRPWFIGIMILSFLAFASVMLILLNNVKKRKIISSLLEKTKHVSDYELMKHALTIKAMNAALWDKEITDEPYKDTNPFDSDSPFVFSKEFRQMLGYTDEDEFPNVFASCVNSIHPDDRERVIKNMTAHLKDRAGKTPFDTELRIKTKSGGYRFFSLFGETLRDKTGAPLRIAGAIKDITEETEMKEALKKREEMLKILNEAAIVFLSHSNNAFEDMMNKGVRLIAGIFDLDGVSVFRITEKENGVDARQVYNWDIHEGTTNPPEELQEVFFLDMLVPNWAKTFKSGMQLNGPKSSMLPEEAAVMEKYGIASVCATPVFIDGSLWGFVLFEGKKDERYFDAVSSEIMRSAAFLCVNTIINAESGKAYMEQSLQLALREKERETDQKYLAEIESARKMAEEANRAKSVFLANMSHEIRTPMNSIIGFAELARNNDNPPETGEYLKKISQSAELLLSIINDILDISKIESGKMELEHIPFDLEEIFSYCRTVILPKANEKGLSLYCYTEPYAGRRLAGDPVKLRQALLNLLFNAVKFTNKGAVKLLASVKNTDGKRAAICFEVKDSGIGMNAEQIAKIFKPFAQADSSITRKYGGTGLGLTITRNIVELMGGELKVESVQGIGSRFFFELAFDVINTEAETPPEKKDSGKMEKPVFEGEALVCEDNAMNQEVICEHLLRVGLKTVIAENGKEGIDMINRSIENGKPFDLIFMDIHMPVMDGIEATKQLMDSGCKIPIIALTANIMASDREAYLAMGMRDCLPKPFTKNDLWSCLLKFLKPVNGKEQI